MILIADSGSTKTDWVLADGCIQGTYRTIGYNPYFIGSEKIFDSVNSELAPQLQPDNIKYIYFYGAGCSNEENNLVVKKALQKCFANSEVWIGHDMLAAARALLGREQGFAAILGTGANTCVYNGSKIIKNIDSLGFLLGDEGSGSYIGKKILRDYLRGFLPEQLEKKFREKYTISESEIYQRLYHQVLPNRFLASFCEFASENSLHGHIRKIVETSFNDFFRHLVIRYPEHRNYKFNCIGAVGFVFRDILEKVSLSYNMIPGKILRSPIDDLVRYHLQA